MRVFSLGLVQLLLVEHPIITLHPNCPKHNVAKEVSNLDALHKVLTNSFSKESLFPMETIIVACPSPTKLVHVVSRPPPCSLCSMNGEPASLQLPSPTNVFFVSLIHVNQLSISFGTTSKPNHLVPNGSFKSSFIARAHMIPNMRLVKLVVPWEVALLFVRHPCCVRNHVND